MNPTTQLAPIDTIKQMLVANHAKIAKALPQHIKADRMIRVTLNALEATPELLACTPNSLYRCVMEASTYGWEIGGPLAEAYIVPFKDRATLIPGYRGLLNLVTRTGSVKELIRQIVREGDYFEIDPINGISHKYGAERGTWTHAYVMARYHDGSLSQPLVMSRAEIESHRDRYAKGHQRSDSPWRTELEKMALKTVIRQFITGGYVQTSAEIVGFASRESVIEAVDVGEARSEDGDRISDPVVLQLPKTEDETVAQAAAETVSQQTVASVDDWDVAAEFEKNLVAATTEADIEEVRKYFLGKCENEDQRAYVGMSCDDALANDVVTNDGELFEKNDNIGT